MILGRLRTSGLERVERTLVRVFSVGRDGIRGTTEEFAERGILDSLAIYALSTADGGAVYALAYDCRGAEFPVFLEGWKGLSLEEIRGALWMVEQGIKAVMSPLVISSHPALLRYAWGGWGPVQAASYLSFFALAAASSSVLRSSDATGVG